MSETVSGQLEDTKTGLARRLYQNGELCGALGGLLGRLVIECQRRGCGIGDVHMGPIANRGRGMFGSRVTFHYRGMMVPAGFGAKGTLEEYLANKGVQMAKVLAENYSVNQFFEALIQGMDSYAKDRGVQFQELWVKQAFLSKDDELAIEIGHGEKTYDLKEAKHGMRKES